MASVSESEQLLFEAVFKEIVGQDQDTLDPSEAVIFLRKSGLDDAVLHDVRAACSLAATCTPS